MKHPYSVNLRERQVTSFFLALIAIGVSILLANLLFAFNLHTPGWLDLPGGFTVFGLLFLWFDRVLWRMPVVRALGIQTPIVGGSWTGIVTSSYGGHVNETPVTAIIDQDWTTIAIRLEAAYSTSWSTVAAVSVGPGTSIVYSFTNRPNANAVEGMHAHEGTATLWVTPTGLSGEYYTGRDRNTIGRIELYKRTQSPSAATLAGA